MTDYIGARLSLISKSDIRYVGILHEIDSANSTVSLEQVRSFGTEGRKGDPALEIPGSDNVFEYIIFRGSDVKDLRVEEGASKQQQPPAQDPAILQSGAASHQGNAQGYQGQGYGMANPGYGYPPQHHQQQFAGPPQSYGYPAQSKPHQPQGNQGLFAPPPQNAFPDLPSDTRGEALSASTPAAAPRQDAPLKTEASKGRQAKVVPALPLPSHAPSPKPKSSKEVEQLASGLGNLSTSSQDGQAPKRNALLGVQKNMKSSAPTSTGSIQGSVQQQTENRQPIPPASTDARGGRQSPSVPRKDPGIFQNGVIVNPNASIIIPSDEYDFSLANSKFSKDSVASEISTAPVYNKKSSFFDSISSEATDRVDGGGGRGRGREARTQERSMNYETFGEDLAFRNNRGRGRGGRGRGRGRGRGQSQGVQQ